MPLSHCQILLIAAHFAQASDENRVYKENTQGYEKNACPAIADCENAVNKSIATFKF